jgi:hypothetical protein
LKAVFSAILALPLEIPVGGSMHAKNDVGPMDPLVGELGIWALLVHEGDLRGKTIFGPGLTLERHPPKFRLGTTVQL